MLDELQCLRDEGVRGLDAFQQSQSILREAGQRYNA